MFLHLVFGWAIFTAVFSFQLVQIFLYGQEKIALVDIRNIPVLLVLLGVPLIPITIHSFKKLTSAEKTYWSWFCLFGVYGIFVLALIFIRNLNAIAIYSSAIIDTSIILCQAGYPLQALYNEQRKGRKMFSAFSCRLCHRM